MAEGKGNRALGCIYCWEAFVCKARGAMMIRQWKRAFFEGATGVFERGGRKKPEFDEVKELHARRACPK
ncbi:hypothetical protein V8352_20590 [Roseovarius sp. D0-M9]